jgi:hypothetical protein
MFDGAELKKYQSSGCGYKYRLSGQAPSMLAVERHCQMQGYCHGFDAGAKLPGSEESTGVRT